MSRLSKIFENEDMEKITNEFTRLKEKCYLDNAGAALYPQSLIQVVKDDLINNVYMNPHTSTYTKDCIEHIRTLILNHFNTDLKNYAVIFTSGATQSLKLVAESFQFTLKNDNTSKLGSFIYLVDNHTSVIGMREIAGDKQADIIPMTHADFLATTSASPSKSLSYRDPDESNTLFVYPAQSNFNGFKYPLDCINDIQEGSLNEIIENIWKPLHNWYVMLDAASYVGTNRLDLSKNQPDFVCLSFYKMFGYPTGLGALLVKKSSAAVLSDKHYFGGGTVDIFISNEDFHVKRSDIQDRFEDGTVSYLSIIDLKHCFNAIFNLIPKIINNDIMETISHHTYYLAKDLYTLLSRLQHNNGTKAAVLYMDSDFTDTEKQGGVVTFNIVRSDGSYIGYSEFQHMADLFGISVRTGCFCNSGSCQRHLKQSNEQLKQAYSAGHICSDNVDLINGEPTGAVRVSFAYYNTYDDVDRLVSMICRCFVSMQYLKPKRSVMFEKNIPLVKPYGLKGIMVKPFPTEPIPEVSDVARPINSRHVHSQPPESSNIILTDIVLYPIKSCGALKVKSAWPLGSKGLLFDREWMIVNHNGVCVTQKQNTRMCLIKPLIDLKRNLLILRFEGLVPFSIPINTPGQKESTSQVCQNKICSDMVKSYDCGDDAAQWISEALEESFLRLVKQSSDDQRAVKSNGKSHRRKLGLSNQAQFLLINKATVRWLKDKIEDVTFQDDVEQLTDRFRGNLIIDTDRELIERKWQSLIIENHEFIVEGVCSRCQMVCIDQTTGEKTIEPLRTIAHEFAGKLRFGIYLTYVGSVNGHKDRLLQNNTNVMPILSDTLNRQYYFSLRNERSNSAYVAETRTRRGTRGAVPSVPRFRPVHIKTCYVCSDLNPDCIV